MIGFRSRLHTRLNWNISPRPMTSPNFHAYIALAVPPGLSGPSGWAASIVSADGSRQRLAGGEGRSSANVMALRAVLATVSALPADSAATVFLDSAYVVRGVYDWRPAWEARNWRSADGPIIANYQLWRSLFAQLDARPLVRLERCRGADHFEEMEPLRLVARDEARKAAGLAQAA
ncbi:RNase H family protein [Ancylobacter terrae]|uniref:RNase H family protein n=1 Tax=Ancylobacter sp. sgz301288 TaxID=3342077 RepID=UPI00385FE8C3